MEIFKTKNKAYIKSTYAKLIASYLLFIILFTVVLSAVLYYMFYQTTMEVIKQNTNERLGQNINHLNLIRNRSSALGLELIQDSDIKKILYSNYILEEDKYSILRKLNRLIISDSILHSIYLYNAKAGVVLSTVNNNNEYYNKRIIEILEENKSGYSPSDFIPSRIVYNKTSGDIINDNIISTLFYDNDYNNFDSEVLNSSIIINLKADDIQKSISSLIPDEQTNIIVSNKRGIVVFDSLSSKFGTDISGENFFKDIIFSKTNEGNNIENVYGRKALVMYKSYGVTSWVFINISTFESMFGRFFTLRSAIIIFCCTLLLVGIILSILAAKSIYLPFDRLLKKVKLDMLTDVDAESNRKGLNDVQYLTETFKSIILKTNQLEDSERTNSPMVKNAYMRALITGDLSYNTENISKYKELFEKMFVDENGGYLSVLVFKIDVLLDPEKAKKVFDMHVKKLAIESFITQLLSEKYYCELIDLENNYFCMILKVDYENQLIMEVKDIIRSIQRNLQDSFSKSITCSIGMPVKVIRDVYISYSNSMDMIKYGFVYGYGSLFTYDMNEVSAKKLYITYDKNKEKLIQSIRMSDFVQVNTELMRIFDEIKQCSYDYMMLLLNQLMLDIVTSVQTILDDNSEDLDFNNIYSNLNRTGTLDEAKTFFELYCKGIIDKLEKKKMNRKNEMICQMIKYIDDNYFKNDITTESLAEIANLTPGYFGKIFSDNTGKSVSEYTINLRLAKAKELLINTNITINDISFKIGFNSTTYFTKLFKMTFGITPNQYRADNKISSKIND